MTKENPADYGEPKTQQPLYEQSDRVLNKAEKDGKIVTGESEEKLSTQTPDPNVESLGDTTGDVAEVTTPAQARSAARNSSTSRSTSTTIGT